MKIANVNGGQVVGPRTNSTRNLGTKVTFPSTLTIYKAEGRW